MPSSNPVALLDYADVEVAISLKEYDRSRLYGSSLTADGSVLPVCQ